MCESISGLSPLLPLPSCLFQCPLTSFIITPLRSLFRFLYFFFFHFWWPCDILIPKPGIRFLCCSCNNARSPTYCAGLWIKPMFLCSRDAADPVAPQWELQLLYFSFPLSLMEFQFLKYIYVCTAYILYVYMCFLH